MDLLKDKESVAKVKGIGIWNEEERNKFNNNDVSLSIKEIILLIGLSVALYFYKKIDEFDTKYYDIGVNRLRYNLDY